MIWKSIDYIEKEWSIYFAVFHSFKSSVKSINQAMGNEDPVEDGDEPGEEDGNFLETRHGRRCSRRKKRE